MNYVEGFQLVNQHLYLFLIVLNANLHPINLIKTKTLFLTFILFFSCEILFSQNIENSTNPLYNKNQIGIQLNPYLDDNLFHGLIMETVYSIRYGYKISKPLIIGAEVSGYFPYFFNEANPDQTSMNCQSRQRMFLMDNQGRIVLGLERIQILY